MMQLMIGVSSVMVDKKKMKIVKNVEVKDIMGIDEITGNRLRLVILEQKLEKIKNFRKTLPIDTEPWALNHWADVEEVLEKELEMENENESRN
jgi:hypothetical protein